MYGLDICSGVGGLAEALAPWIEWKSYCENDPAKQSMLVSRMSRREVQTAPIWDDVRTLRGGVLPEIDFIGAATPCTDISLAGNRTGLGGERSGIIWHVPRLAKETNASVVFLENVWPGIRKFVPSIRASFEELGFSVRDGVLSAGDCGAWHERKRWFLLATHPERLALRLQLGRWNGKSWTKKIRPSGPLSKGPDPDAFGMQIGVAAPERRQQKDDASEALEPRENPHARRLRGSTGVVPFRYDEALPFGIDLLEGDDWDKRAAFLLRVDSGLPHRGHRIRAMGDAVPPIVYQEAFMRLTGIG